MKLFSSLFKKKKPTSQLYKIGRYQLELPSNHNLPRFQEKFKRYDRPLAEIIIQMSKKYSHFKAIDIGANIGDSAAVMRSHADAPLLCIEGHPSFLPYLKKNISLLGKDLSIEEAFVGESRIGQLEALPENRGTASIVEFTSIPTLSLGAILEKHPLFHSFQFLKIDTDGFDFKIINHAKEEISRERPIIFFEYDIHFSSKGGEEGKEVLNLLGNMGYSSFRIYDNFGNLMLKLSLDEIDKMDELNDYLKSNRENGTVIYYYDICALHQKDNDLFN